MTRRTKLLIAAVFTVLLGIVAVYCVFAWRPANPLRFRAICYEYDGAPMPMFHGECTMVRFSVENTSTAWVSLAEAQIQTTRPAHDAHIGLIVPDFQSLGGTPVPDAGTISIPPHQTVHVVAMVGIERREEFASGEVSVLYLWNSSLRKGYSRCIGELRHFLPEIFYSYLPDGADMWELTSLQPLQPTESTPANQKPSLKNHP